MLNRTEGYSSLPVNYLQQQTTTDPQKLIDGIKVGPDLQGKDHRPVRELSGFIKLWIPAFLDDCEDEKAPHGTTCRA